MLEFLCKFQIASQFNGPASFFCAGWNLAAFRGCGCLRFSSGELAFRDGCPYPSERGSAHEVGGVPLQSRIAARKSVAKGATPS